MEPTEKIRKFVEFLEKHYPSKDLNSPRKIVDIQQLMVYDPVLMDEFDKSDVEETFKAADLAGEHVYEKYGSKNTKIRFRGWHKLDSYISLLRDIRSEDLGKMVTVECDISVFAPPKSSVSSTRWECPSCGNVVTMLQFEKDKLNKPRGCGCGRKGGFRKLSTEFMDVQKLAVREPLELIEHNVQNPRQMGVLLKGDMCHKDMDLLIAAGIRIYLTAVVELEKPDQPESDFILDAHYIHFVEEDKSVQFTNDEVKEFKKFSEDTANILDAFGKSFAPHLSGEFDAKKALLLMTISGDEKKNQFSKDTNQINILFVGDPGSGKSQLGMQVREVFPRTRYINAQTTTSVGLTASAVKDEFLGGWSIQAGEIVLAHRGVLIIDDFDGMAKEEQDSLHEAMSLKTIHKSAGNASATLKCETNVLAIANPKYKVWDKMQTIGNQIEISKSLLNRFDLIYIFKSKTRYDEIEEGLEKIYSTFFEGSDIEEEQKVSYDFMKKYLSYAKTLNPTMSKAVLERCKFFFQKILDKSKSGAIPLTYRQAVSFFKIAKASAKLRLKPKVEDYDAIVAYNTMLQFMKSVAFDEETGSFDIEVIEGDVKHSRKDKFRKLFELIKTLSDENKGQGIRYDDVVVKAMEQLDMDTMEIDSYIDKLKEKGDVFFPKVGVIALLQ